MKQTTKEIRWVHGSKTSVWYPVDKSDRDFAYGLTTAEINTMTDEEAVKKYEKAVII